MWKIYNETIQIQSNPFLLGLGVVGQALMPRLSNAMVYFTPPYFTEGEGKKPCSCKL